MPTDLAPRAVQIVRWGNGRGRSQFLPRTAWTWLETLQQGAWQGSGAIKVKILASFGLDKGVWYPIRQGIRGILVPDEQGIAVA